MSNTTTTTNESQQIEDQQQEQQEEEIIDYSANGIFESALKDFKQLIKKVKERKATLKDLLLFYYDDLPLKLSIIDLKLDIVRQKLQAAGIFQEDTTIADLMAEIKERQRRELYSEQTNKQTNK